MTKIRRLFNLAILAASTSVTWSAFANSIILDNLFPTVGLVPNIAVPFRVYDSQRSAYKIQQVTFDQQSQSCTSKIDPFYPDIVHVRCPQPGTVRFDIYAFDGQALKLVRSPILNFTYPEGGTPIDPGPPDDPDIAVGQGLFTSFCISCHTPASRKGRSAASISAAYVSGGPPSMVSLNPKPTAAQINKIAKYLGTIP